jgi:peptidoglycan/xylan/chitin deacetylase (PgdA/CDA1 family)
MTNNDLTVVMYHYVRDLKFSRYPEIKGLDNRLFKEQIEYLEKYYTFVTVEQIISAHVNDEKLPKNAILLTFDDGYIDHYTNVFPLLLSKGIQGAFYPPVRAINENKILDVNKIHFILASASDINQVLLEIKRLLVQFREEYQLSTYEHYFEKLAIASRYDTKEVIFIKRLLQVELVESLRLKMTDELFKSVVKVSEDVFSRELYMNKEQLSCMVSNGMHVGSHGFDHYWLGSLSKENQRTEIVKSIAFIKEIGGNIDQWTICYPYGDYNEDTITLLNEYNCSLGFTTRVGLANIDGNTDDKFKLPRLDTNDLPKDKFATVNNWLPIH